MTTIIDSHGNRSEEIERENKFTKKIKEIISDLKSGSISQESRIERSIEKLTNVNINNTKNAKEVVKQNTIKTANAGYLFLRTLLFITTIIIGIYFFTKIYDLITKLTLALGSNYLQIVSLGYISITITVLIIINLIIFSYPFAEEETKSKIMGTETKIIVGLTLFLISFNVLGGQSFITNYTAEEKTQIITENVNKTSVSFWQSFKCNFDQVCLQERLTAKTADNTIRSTYSLVFEKPPQISKPLEQWQAREISLNYKIASSGNLTINKIECYQEKINENNLLDSREINRIVNTDGQITNLPNIACDMKKLKVSGKTKTEDITIIPVLYMTIDSIYTLKIPIIYEKLYIEQTGEKGPIAYLDPKTIDFMKKNNKQFEVKQTDTALTFKVLGIQNSFPLIYGNQDSLKFDIPIEISPNSANPLGKIESTTLIENPIVSQYFTYEETSKNFSKSNDDTKLYYSLYLTENENIADKIDLSIIIANIDLKIRSTLKKEDMSTRFKITIRDIDTTNQINNSQNNINTQYNYNTLMLKYVPLKQSIKEPYSNEIQYKINGIENLISLIIPYETRTDLNVDELATKNAYLYGLNENINQLEQLVKTQTNISNTQTTENIYSPPIIS